MSLVFECRKCGQCCEGRGGIVVSPSDLQRLCLYLEVDARTFSERYGETRNGKLNIRVGADDCCVFFDSGSGCRVHEAKPDICRAWPFFRGNLVDAQSLSLAKEYCAGIRKDVRPDEFRSAGQKYLSDNHLLAVNPDCEARALILNDK